MSQGISAALDLLNDRIEAISPKTDSSQGFVCVDSAGGAELLTDRRASSIRYFETRLTTYPHDDGQAGITGRKRLTAEIRVRYDLPKDIGLLERMIGEDSSSIINTLRDPSYSLITTGITSLITGESTTESILDDTASILGALLIVPFDLLFSEA
tara:strand:- start:354 stop:818 length:465 start_codon:yes stop_codon:yes gene_type:complete